MSNLALYTYFQSSAAFRVRIALHLKGLAYQPRLINLFEANNGLSSNRFLGTNPQGFVPVLVDGPLVLSQSLAIIEYLEEKIPYPGLLPHDAYPRAYVRALAQIVACDIHPLQTPRIRQYLHRQLHCSEEDVVAWQQHWITTGLEAFEAQLNRWGQYGEFCCGDNPTIADICLVPQVHIAQRINCDLGATPQISRIYATCMQMSEFIAATPDVQPDATDLCSA